MSLEGIYMCSSWGPLSYACKLIYICIFLIRDIFGVRREHCMTYFFSPFQDSCIVLYLDLRESKLKIMLLY